MNNNKILTASGITTIPSKAVYFNGKWLTTAEWLDETLNNSLPLTEPLKSYVKDKIYRGAYS